MKRNFFLFALAIYLLSTLIVYSEPCEDLESVYQQMITMEADPNNVVPVEGLFWEKDAALFSINSGKIYFMKPIGGKVRAAVFIGEGDFQFVPSTKVEKIQLDRFYHTEFYSNTFDAMFLFFADSTYEFITENFKPIQSSIPDKVFETLKSSYEYIIDSENQFVEENITKVLLDDASNDYFYADIKVDSEKPVFYTFNPYEIEEVSFSRGYWYGGLGDFAETICEFNKKEDFLVEKEEIEMEKKDEFDIYDMYFEVDIDKNYYSKINLDMKIKSLKDDLQWLPMILLDDMIVNGIKDIEGNQLYFYKPKESWMLYVKLDKPLMKNDSIIINLDYEGEMIRRYGDFSMLKSSVVWYPHYGQREKSNYEAKFTVSDRYEFNCVGKLLDKEENDELDAITYHYKTEYPLRNYSFIIGVYDIAEIEEDDVVPMKLYYRNSFQLKSVKEDFINSFRFYSNFFGQVPIKKLCVSEIPGGHGEAFPGLTHLSISAFTGQDWEGYEGLFESFVSHEMAHQWWGIEVDFKSYRDQWISEAFAEYSSLMYTQQALKDNEKFFRILHNSRNRLVELNESNSNVRVKPGPISLGRRTNSITSYGDYNIIIYQKGAWVLHMIRNLFMQVTPQGFNEDNFINLMKDFYNKYKGKYACTREFQEMVTEYAGSDVSWFFDQWVHGNEIPKYKWGYDVTENEDGTYRIKMKVKTENVSDDWMMPVPIQITFEDGAKTMPIRLNLNQNYAEIDLGNSPKDVDKIDFNVNLSVLCEQEEEDYKDILNE